MSVLDTLLISAYNYLDSTAQEQKLENAKATNNKIVSSSLLTDGTDEIGDESNNQLTDPYALGDESSPKLYFTSDSSVSYRRKAKNYFKESGLSEFVGDSPQSTVE